MSSATSQPAQVDSPLPPKWRRDTVYEGLLTFVLLFGVVSLVRWIVGPSAVSRAVPDIHLELLFVGAGVAVLITILILSPIGRASGGHMNPAISVAMWRYRVFRRAGVPYYIGAQLVGSIAGVFAGRLAWGPDVAHPPVAYASLQPAPGWSFWGLFVVETLTMAAIILVVGVFLAIPRLAGAVPYLVGLLVGATIAGLGTVTGGSANPARQFGPALISGRTHLLAAYLLAPILGAFIAPVVRDMFQSRRLSTHALCGPAAQRA